MSTETLLKATAGSFKEAWRLVDATLKVAETRSDSAVTRTQAEDVLLVFFQGRYVLAVIDSFWTGIERSKPTWTSISMRKLNLSTLVSILPAVPGRSKCVLFTHFLN